jgi:hypothetical protein
MFAKLLIILMFERVVHVINSVSLNAESIVSVTCRVQLQTRWEESHKLRVGKDLE